MNNFFTWLIQSSSDPDKVALTVKGALLGLIPLVIMAARVLNFNFLPQDLEQLAIGVSGFCSIALTVVGLVRKIYLTLKK